MWFVLLYVPFIVCSNGFEYLNMFLLVPVFGDFSGIWVVQTYSFLQYIYVVF